MRIHIRYNATAEIGNEAYNLLPITDQITKIPPAEITCHIWYLASVIH